MQVITLFLLFFLLSHQTLIGYNSIPEAKLATLQKTDPAFALTFQAIDNAFSQHCQIPLRNTLSVAYQVVQGIKYNIVFDTKYGPLNAIAITQYWEKTVDISFLNFIEPQNSVNLANTTKSNNGTSSTQATSTATSTSINASSSATGSNSRTTNQNQTSLTKTSGQKQTQIKFPDLKKKCDMMKDQINKLQGDTPSNETTFDVVVKTQQLNGNTSVPRNMSSVRTSESNSVNSATLISSGSSGTRDSTSSNDVNNPINSNAPSSSLSPLFSNSLDGIFAPLNSSPKPTTTQVDLGDTSSQQSSALFSTSASTLNSKLSKSSIFSWP